MDINRNYEKLKMLRTYIGGSKKKELQVFLKSQGMSEGEVFNENKEYVIDWFEFRRLVIAQFEDILCVNYSRRFYAEKLAYLFLSISVILYKIKLLSLISAGIAILFYALSKLYKRIGSRNILNYYVAISLTNNMIYRESGLKFPDIE